MISTDDFIRRLTAVMEYYNLSASAFADKIGVQRSGLSHLLSGRNKPSLDFVIKIIESFPDVDLYWILFNKGRFPAQTEGEISTPTAKSEPAKDSELAPENPETEPRLQHSTKDSRTLGDIDRIMVFYSDGSFTEHHPR